jgi:hypothetical protein
MLSKFKSHLITFADGHPAYKYAASRLCTQAQETAWFSSVSQYDIGTLEKCDAEWFSSHIKFISNNMRGFGYWIWKPKIIYENLIRIPDNETLIYMDGGCELNKYGLKLMCTYLELTGKSELLAFHLPSENGNCIEGWTKKHLLNYHTDNYSQVNDQGNMIEAGIILLKNTRAVREFIRIWLDVIVADNYRLVNDDNCGEIESPIFKENRHDQSILTLLLNHFNLGVTLQNDSYHPHLWELGLYDIESPFVAFRNISIQSKLDQMDPIFNFNGRYIKLI